MKPIKEVSCPDYHTYGDILKEVERLAFKKPIEIKSVPWDFYLYDNNKTTSIISKGKEIMVAENNNKEDLEDLKNAAKQCLRQK